MTRKKQKTLSIWIMLAVIALLAAAIFMIPSCMSQDGNGTLVKEGEQAPDFSVQILNGAEISLADLRGNVVLLNFWATWCSPCRVELQQAQAELIDRFAGRDFVFLPISRGEDRATVEKFRNQNGYLFPLGLDPEQKIYNLYATSYIPCNFLIDKNGRVIKISVGYNQEEFDEIIQTIEAELQKQ